MSAPVSRPGFSRRDFLRFSAAMSAAAAISGHPRRLRRPRLDQFGRAPAATRTSSRPSSATATTRAGTRRRRRRPSPWPPTTTSTRAWSTPTRSPASRTRRWPPRCRPTPSATSWKFTLRDGAKWHDGQPVTVDDVVFTFDRVLDPRPTLASAFFAAGSRRSGRSTTHTVELVFNFPFPDALRGSTIAKIMPKHVFGVAGRLGRRAKAARRSARARTGRPRTTRSRTPPSRPSPTTTARARPTFKKMNWLSIVDASRPGREDLRRPAPRRRSPTTSRTRTSTSSAGLGPDRRGRQGHEPHVPDVQHRRRSRSTTCGCARRCFYAIDTAEDDRGRAQGPRHRRRPASSTRQNPAYAKAKTVYGYDPDKAKALLAAAGVHEPVGRR